MSIRNRATALASTILASSLLFGSVLAASPARAADATTVTTVAPTLASRLAAVKVAKTINYYPSDAGWSAMWTGFDPVAIDADLATAATLGADNVRVIVFPDTFGYPAPQVEYTEKLRKFISIAESHGMTVKITLFDWWAGYSDAARSIGWAKAILDPYKDDPRVLAVELKNEFQPSDADAIAWVRQVIPAVRAAAPAMPLTLSVDGGTGATGMASIKAALVSTPLDYYDFHFYGNSERSLAEIRKAQAAVSPAPIVIGETGISSGATSEGEQALYLARVFRAATEAGVGSVAPWTLNDFSAGAIPSNSTVSTIPAQYTFGLYRADGSAKLAASVVRTAWTTGTVPNTFLNLGFEAADIDSPWKQNLPQAGAGVVTSEMPRLGARSLKFSGTTRTSAGLPSMRVAPITPVQPGYKWRAEAFARGFNATGITEISLSWFDATGKWISESTSNRLPVGNTTWTKLVVDTVAPAGAAAVQLHLKNADNTGTVYFDDVAIS
ncbi:cellulase family glycosylhydrolase [Actinoplanes oblitus]|uniref:Cellulase family glycosylhydrolase n=1 Tax=Actinoplanes oblitus TaxID=3040509 RepID=A0ABY8W790_9ACTN|nr:cellulase family glycosylhydrolase [Actinoplanes oblitus]WIM93533.1 cellulase family glycosylhydrolase [Actinoplanes oblitus]